MIRYTDPNQITIDEFIQPFGGELDKNNRWVKESMLIPWNELARIYYAKMCSNFGAPAKDARLVIGAIVIKHKLNLSDEETAEMIRENPYMQYFLGLKEYSNSYVFHPSLFVAIRKRLGVEDFNQMCILLLERLKELQEIQTKKQNENDKSGSDDSKPDQSDKSIPDKQEQPTHHGKLILDATIANQAIKYPNDLDLLNDAREFTEQFIDVCWQGFGLTNKPRTYRRTARKEYLAVAKLKNKSAKVLRKAVGKQLNYLRRNLGCLEAVLVALPKEHLLAIQAKVWRKFWIIQELYRQQREMHSARSHRCDDRIVSIGQPHVRPMVRGKSNAKVEFGGKVGISLFNGFATIDNLSWNAYHEAIDLKKAVENFKATQGFYPEVVVADPAYGTRENRQFLKELGIRFGGKPLGKPKKETPENREELKALKKQRHSDYLDRIPVEGKFGQGKGRYRLNYIRAKLAITAAGWIGAIFLVMNIVKMTKSSSVFLFALISNWFCRQYSDKLVRKLSDNGLFCYSVA